MWSAAAAEYRDEDEMILPLPKHFGVVLVTIEAMKMKTMDWGAPRIVLHQLFESNARILVGLNFSQG